MVACYLGCMVCCTTSCVQAVLGSDPENTPEGNFDALVKDFRATYSFTELKGINWDSLSAVYRPRVTPQTSSEQLFRVMEAMLNSLKDGHVSLYTPFGVSVYTGWYDRYPTNFLGTRAIGLRERNQTPGGIVHGELESGIGYMYVPSFDRPRSEYEVIEAVLARSVKGVIIDVRSNGGGSDALARILAGRFATERRVFRYLRWRTAPGANGFGDYIADYIEPSSAQPYTKPVIVLTNRRVFSSAESFVEMMRVQPAVVVMGDTTGGGSGNPAFRTLPNGFVYRIPRWISYTPERRTYEGIGLAPTIPVSITRADSLAGRDAIVEAALRRLR